VSGPSWKTISGVQLWADKVKKEMRKRRKERRFRKEVEKREKDLHLEEAVEEVF